MKRVKMIEMPREDIRLDELEKAMIGAGDNCGTYEQCLNAMRSTCHTFNTNPCTCGGALLFCVSYSM